jgi:hypothetical protein
MEKEFIPYEQALALKELGFDEPCFKYYVDNKLIQNGLDILNKDCNWVDNQCLAPLYQQVFRWFREKYKLDVTFRKMDYGPESQFTGYYFSVYRGNELIDIHGADKKCKVYEDSELECLKKLIEIVKEK